MFGTAGTWLAALWSLTFVSLFFIEKPIRGGRPRRVELSVLAVLFLFSLILAVTGLPILSTAIALALTVLIGAASREKYAHTSDNLNFNDVRFAVHQGGLSFIARTYRKLVGKALILLSGGVCFVAIVAVASPDTAVPYTTGLAMLLSVAVLVAVAVLLRGTDQIQRIFLLAGDDRGHFLGFMASVAFTLLSPKRKLKMKNVDARPAVLRGTPGKGRRPHIILIHHESTFDPAVYDLPVTPLIQNFLRPEEGISGRLKVDIFGGMSWMTEFAVQTGLSACCFGSDARFIFHFGEGRFGHSLPAYLKRIGYQTIMATTMYHNFMNYSRFYRSIGMQHTLFCSDYARQFRTPDLLRSHSDEALYAAVLDWVAVRREENRPLFLNMLTNFNHGPHDRRVLPEKLDYGARAFAMKALDDPSYGEYFARLDFSARCYNSFKANAIRLLRDEPILFIRYGDHQPQFVSDVPALNRRADFQAKRQHTFYAIEAHGFALDGTAGAGCEVLDAAFLCTLAMKAAGLPSDPLREIHFDLIPECGAGYFDAQSVAKARFHRLLLDQGLVKAQH